MIFTLRCTVNELAGAPREQLEAAFSRLVDSDRSGRHYFILQRELSRWAVANLQLSGRDLAHLKRLQEEYTIRGGLLEDARACVDVTIGGAAITIDGEDAFSIGLQPLVQGEYLLSRTCLVVEDAHSDGELYSHIFKTTRKITKVPSIAMQVIHGGGSGTDREFSRAIDQRKVVVCIADHDGLAPMDKKSATAKKVEGIYRARNIDSDSLDPSFIGLGVVTIGRELENHIPYVLLKVMGDYGSYSNFDKLDAMIDQDGCVASDSCFWQYFDIKHGVRGSVLAEKRAKGDISIDVLDWICEKIGVQPEDVEGCCISGFGMNVVDNFLSNREALKGFHKFVRSDYWRFMFGAYFERLLWYFAAPTGSRT